MPSSLGEAAVHLAIALFVWRDPGRRQQLGSRATAGFTREQLCQDRRMADESVADRLRGFGVKGILVQMAERGQILELKCEMPQCYHPNGRDKFESLATERRLWAPSRDHYPILRSAGGELRADNVRLSHVECNQRDHTRRKQIGGTAPCRRITGRHRRRAEPQEDPRVSRNETMDGGHGARGLRVLVRVPLRATITP